MSSFDIGTCYLYKGLITSSAFTGHLLSQLLLCVAGTSTRVISFVISHLATLLGFGFLVFISVRLREITISAACKKLLAKGKKPICSLCP